MLKNIFRVYSSTGAIKGRVSDGKAITSDFSGAWNYYAAPMLPEMNVNDMID